MVTKRRGHLAPSLAVHLDGPRADTGRETVVPREAETRPLTRLPSAAGSTAPVAIRAGPGCPVPVHRVGVQEVGVAA